MPSFLMHWRRQRAAHKTTGFPLLPWVVLTSRATPMGGGTYEECPLHQAGEHGMFDRRCETDLLVSVKGVRRALGGVLVTTPGLYKVCGGPWGGSASDAYARKASAPSSDEPATAFFAFLRRGARGSSHCKRHR